MSDFITDTSIFIAAEQRRPLGDPPEGRSRISVATLTELLVGVEAASDERVRAGREETLAEARRFHALRYDEYVASALARLIWKARETGRRAEAMDTIIAATALVHDLTVWTHDADFEVLAELEPELRVQRA